ncbi:amidohydrolase family protein [Rhizobium binxianense]
MTAPALPRGACDCAIHVYEKRFPLAPSATFWPPEAPLSAYDAERRAVGLERVIIAQPTAYGFDNRCTVEAVAAFGEEARGLAVIPPDVSDHDVAVLDGGGFRGVRYMLFPGGALPAEALPAIASRVAPFGWHINLRMDGRHLPDLMPALAASPATLVVDFDLGTFDEGTNEASSGFKALRNLLDAGRCWLKLAAPYPFWLSGRHGPEVLRHLPSLLIRAYPGRCVWASNWPHPNVDSAPTLQAQLDWLHTCAGPEATPSVLVDTPAALYGLRRQ